MATDDSNFYSQIAASLADNSFDDSDEEPVKLTSADTKNLAQTVDVDDMDASLFSSLTSGTSRRRNSQNQKNKTTTTPNPPKETSVGAPSVPLEGGNNRRVEVVKKSDVGKNKEVKAAENSKPKFDFEDDILDILSDGDNEPPKKRGKPKIKLNKKSEPIKTDNNPITSLFDNDPPSLELERPGTSRGTSLTDKAHRGNSVTIDTSTPVPDVLKLDTQVMTPRKLNDSKAAVTFDDDDDDILGGLGFDNEKPKSNSRSTATATSSRLDDLLGVNKPNKTAVKTISKSTNSQDRKEAKTTTAEPGDSFQFGSYVPSSVDNSSGPLRRGSLKVPSGRRRGTSGEIDSSLVTRPSTAEPSLTKKSVHFAEKLERPSSSPSAADPTRMSEENGLSTSSQSQDDFGLKKPPQLEKRDPALEDNVTVSGVENQTLPESLTMDESLFPDASKQPLSSSGRRRTASSSALFDDQLPSADVEPDDVASTSSRDSTTTKLTTEDTEKLKHPVFPWQRGGRSSSTETSASRRKNTLQTTTGIEQPQSNTFKAEALPGSHGPSLNQTSNLASFQQQLLQQQKQFQEQLASFQTESNSAVATARATSTTEIERLQGEVKSTGERVKELEGALERKDGELSDKHKILKDTEQELLSSKEARLKLEEKCKETADKLNALDKEAAQVKHELNAQVEELKMKLYKIELEREQLQHTIESTKNRHSEEIESIQKSNESKLKALEESVQRREARWKEETVADSTRFQDKLTFLEHEKTDAVLALKKRIDALEISKTNEIGRLKDVHYSAIEDLKREHELDKQHLLNLHRQELEAIKAAHSHTRMLSDLSRKVEVSTRDMSQLQAKLENTYSTELDERMQRVKTHEEHLKILEAQLMKQKSENNTERDQLQSLIAKMESHVSQQKKQMEHERWQLQQDMAKRTAQQNAFEDERTTTLMKFETERERLEQAKEKFLSEQQEILSKCYGERRSIASERAELSILQKKALERERSNKQLNIQSEAERETLSNQMMEDRSQLVAERTALREEQEQLKLNREAAARDREKLEAYGAEIQQRSQEIEQITETALIVREKGEQSLAESQRLQEELSQQEQALRTRKGDLVDREKRLALEQLSVAQERRLQHHKVMSLSSSVPEPPTEEVNHTNPLLLSSLRAQESQESLLSVSNASLLSYKGPIETLSASAYQSYSPRASPLHVSALNKTTHVNTLLTKMDHSRNVRQWVLEAKKDDEYLEQETNFIQSLQSNPYVY